MLKSIRSFWLALTLAVGLLIILAAYIYLKFEVKKVNIAKGQELEAIARLKSERISSWIEDELFDANLIAHNEILAARLELWLNEPTAGNKQEVGEFLEALRSEHGYEGIFLTGENGNFLLSSDGKEYSMAPYLKEKVAQSIQSQSVLTTDLYRCPVHDTIHIDFIAPVSLQGRAGSEALVFQFDPNTFLYPLVQSWPTLSQSSETLLYKISGDNVLFLNELKHKKNTALNFALPLTETEVVAVKAVNTNHEGFVEGIDYMGNKVLGFVSKIPHTEWLMVSKTDKKELFSGLYYQMAIIILLVVFLLLFLAAGMAYLYNSRQKSMFRDLYKQQEYYRITLSSIGDAVISTNNYGKVEFLNPVAERITGWMNQEAQGENLEEVFKIINEETRQAVESPVQKVLREGNVVGLANHTMLLSKDGREIPIADSGAPIKNEKGEITGVVLVFRDQTEEREYLRKIGQSEAQYRELVESTDSIAWEYDIVKDKWIYVAPQVSDKLGWLPAEWTNLDFLKNNIHPDEREEIISYCLECTTKGKPHSMEYRFRSKDGPYIWLRNIVTVEVQENKPVILRGVMFDITERKEAEIQLKDREFWLSESQRVGKIGSYNFDIVQNHWTSSEVLDQIFGITKEHRHSLEIWFELVHPEQRQEMLEYFQKEVLKEKKPFEKEYKIIRKSDGAERWVYGMGELHFNEKGDPVGMYGTIQDITTPKLFRQQLQESEERFRKAVLLAPIPMMVHDEEGKVLNISEGWTHFSGYTLEDIPTLKEWTEKAHGDKATEVKNYVTGLFNEEKTIINGEYEIVTKTGEKRIWNFYSTLLGKLNGGKKIMLSLAPDITQRVRVQGQLKEAKEKAEEGERLKTAFLANMSHEIRTPLNGILGFTNLIASDDNLTSDKKKWYASIVNKSAEGLLKIINDILDISKLETGKAIIEPKPFDIEKTFLTLHSIFQKKLADTGKKPVRLILKNPGVPLEFHTDETRLIQVFSNLLDNALRFTSKGSVTFGISGITGNKAEFFVADTGTGIAKEKQETIFDRFSQGDIHSRSYGGTGLGLTIVKKILELMGSEITVESEIGQGACFMFQLPYLSSDFNEVDVTIENPAASVQLGKERILIVEDDLVSRLYFQQILANHSAELFFAETGKEALLSFENNHPDVILMDIRLPDINGLEVVQMIREKNKKVIIIAQSAYAMPGDKEKALEAGCNDFIPKPIDSELLLEKLM